MPYWVKNRSHQLALFLLYLAAIAPMFNAIRIWIVMPEYPSAEAIYYFSKMGAHNLFLAGLLSFINIYFFLLNRNKLSWYIQFAGALWIGGSDTIGALFFYLDAPVPFLPTMLPLLVTGCNFIGLGLIKSYVFSKQN